MYLFSLHSVYVFSNFGKQSGLTSKPTRLTNTTIKVEWNNKAHMQDIQ